MGWRTLCWRRSRRQAISSSSARMSHRPPVSVGSLRQRRPLAGSSGGLYWEAHRVVTQARRSSTRLLHVPPAGLHSTSVWRRSHRYDEAGRAPWQRYMWPGAWVVAIPRYSGSPRWPAPSGLRRAGLEGAQAGTVSGGLNPRINGASRISGGCGSGVWAAAGVGFSQDGAWGFVRLCGDDAVVLAAARGRRDGRLDRPTG